MILRGLPRLGVNALTTYELRISQSLTDNAAKRLGKSASIIVFALIKPKRLFVQIPEQMTFLIGQPHTGAVGKAIQSYCLKQHERREASGQPASLAKLRHNFWMSLQERSTPW